MSASSFADFCDCDRYLIVDDTDDDITEILTVVCDGRPSRVALEGGDQ
jgi:hypothetical protein